MGDHAERNLALAHQCDIGAEPVEISDLVLRMGAGDDPERRVEGAGLLDNLPGLEAVGDGDEEELCALDIGGLEQRVVDRIPGQRFNARRPRFGCRHFGHFDDEVRGARALELAMDDPPNPAEANDDNVPRFFGGLEMRLLVGFVLGRCGRGGCQLDPVPDPVEPGKDQRIDEDREQRAGKDEVAPFARQNVERDADPCENEGKFADLGEACGHGERNPGLVAEEPHDDIGRERLAEHDDEKDREDFKRGGQQDPRIEQHADGDEKEHRKGIAQGQGFFCGALAELRFAQDHAREERAEREGNAEQDRRAVCDAQRDGEHGETEQLARAGVRDIVEQHRHHLAPHQQHDGNEGDGLCEREEQGQRHGAGAERLPAQGGQNDEGDHHREVLDDQPPDGDAPALAVDKVALLKSADEDDRARDRERKTEDQPGLQRPAEEMGEEGAQSRRHRNLGERAWNGDGAHGHQVLDRKVEADAEHQKDDADLSQLTGKILIGDEARCERPDRNPREKIAGKGRNAQAIRQHAEQESSDDANDDRGGEGGVMRHVVGVPVQGCDRSMT